MIVILNPPLSWKKYVGMTEWEIKLLRDGNTVPSTIGDKR